jgi:hypothetical protein
MAQIERVPSDLDQAMSLIRDDELDAVTGGIIIIGGLGGPDTNQLLPAVQTELLPAVQRCAVGA